MRPIRVSLVLFGLLSVLVSGFSQTQIINGVVNNYVRVTAFDCVENKVVVTSTAGYAVGDTVILIQMKGAVMDATNTASFGEVTDTLTAGNYEFCIIDSVVPGTGEIFFRYQVIRDYDPAGYVQLVRVPFYPNNATVDGGNLTGQPWNRATGTGGVIAITVGNHLTITSGDHIMAVDMGFQGGPATAFTNSCGCGDPPRDAMFYNVSGSQFGGPKGEGIADYVTGADGGRGAQTNGGGGGNDHNTGGGGGANFGVGGQGSARIYPPSPWWCGGLVCEGAYPGLGGKALTYSNAENKIYMGGGGGAGHIANASGTGSGTAGARGGGIVIVRANSVAGSNRRIRAYGNTVLTDAASDGAGGGGGGGTILLEVNTYTNILRAEVFGGNGGDHNFSGGTDDCMGSGGGGGGGVIWHSGGTLSTNVQTFIQGGNPGVQIGTCSADGPGTATAGTGGTIIPNLVIPESATLPNGCVLPVIFSRFDAKQERDQVELSWSTAEELYNDRFVIERSVDGESFEEIGVVPGSGTTENFVNYSSVDDNPNFGVNFYRLRQIDFNGQSSFSSVKRVIFDANAQLDLVVYPNPVDADAAEVNAQLFMPESGFLRVRLIDAFGKIVSDQTHDAHEGEVKVTVPVENLPGGIYFLRLNTAKLATVRRVSVIK